MAFGKKHESTPANSTGSTEVGGEHRRPTATDVDGDGRDDRVERAERDHRTDRTDTHRTDTHTYRETDGTDRAHEKFGGMNIGAGFFGWLVAIAMTILLIGIVGAVLAAIGSSMSVTQSEAKSSAGTIGIATAVVLLVILALAYYFGGYVAGRMSRFDGARQGALVWIIGLLVTIAAAVVGAVFGTQYNVLDRVNLPRLPISTDQAGLGGIIAVVAVLVVTLLAAILGGKIGNHYHTRVDKAARR